MRASTRWSVSSVPSTGARDFSVARIPLASALSSNSAIAAMGKVRKFREYLQNSARKRWRNRVRHLRHLIGERTIDAEIIREALQTRGLPDRNAPWIFVMHGGCAVP